MTSEEIYNYIAKNYHIRTQAEMAERLGITLSSLKNRMRTLRDRGTIKKKPSNTGQFRKGETAWNKGMRGLSLGNDKTRFKKGQKPHNTHPKGTLVYRDSTKDQGYFISFGGERKMMPYKNYVWEQAYGHIPKGCVIRRLDGDTRNDCLDNLVCISRAEHIALNRNEEKKVAAVRKAKEENRDLEKDSLIASYLAYHKPELKQHILNHHPELIELKRTQLKLNRTIKRNQNAG